MTVAWPPFPHANSASGHRFGFYQTLASNMVGASCGGLVQMPETGALSLAERSPVIMVSSTVYGIEELLERIYAVLTEFGYDVWMSHKGTLPVFSSQSAFENCIAAVKACDLFLGIITPHYGSGVAKGDISITHQELLKAIEINKPRWLLAHDHVVTARALLRCLGHKTSEERARLQFKRSSVFDDLRVIDMYEAATRDEVPLDHRKGNWVQKYVAPEDALRYATAQFYRFHEVERFLKEQLGDRAVIIKRVEEDQK